MSRASLAIGLYAISRIARRPTSLENLWCVAAISRLLLAPGDLTDPSFHLTYAGAGALLFIGRRSERRAGNWVTTTLRFALAVEIAVTPMTLFHFHQYAIGGSLVTLAMSPLIFAMLVVSSIACAFPSDIAFEAIGVLHRLCRHLNALGASGFFAAPPLGALAAGAGVALVAIATVPRRRRPLAVALALLVPSVAAVARSVTGARVTAPIVTFLDVGQGDAILIRSRDGVILVDGGPESRVLPLLADRGVRRITAAVLTHAHPDHCDGLVRAMEELRVDRVWVSPRRFRGECAWRVLGAASDRRVPIHLIRERTSIEAAGIRFDAVTAAINFRRAPENNASVLLRADLDGTRFLFTGDIEKEAELYLADEDLRSDVLKIAHHGSRSSTSDAFLSLVAPRVGVISCGRRNPFGHPHSEVIDALERRRVRTWRTDRDGSVDVVVRQPILYVEGRFD